MDKIAILAGNYEEYKDFMSQKERGVPHEYIYCDSPERIMKYEFSDYKIVGTFGDKPGSLKKLVLVKSRIR